MQQEFIYQKTFIHLEQESSGDVLKLLIHSLIFILYDYPSHHWVLISYQQEVFIYLKYTKSVYDHFYRIHFS